MNLSIIQHKIFEIRHQKVMLDFDLAGLYEVETKAINQGVKRNIERFPEDFMFRLTASEWAVMRSQVVTAGDASPVKRSQPATASQKKRNTTAPPYAFTEHGVTMLAGILRSEKAVKMNIAIVRAFVALRQLITTHKDLSEQLTQLRQELSQRIDEHDTQLSKIYDAIEKLLDEKTEIIKWEDRERIGFRKNV
jgi:hypothetical protein